MLCRKPNFNVDSQKRRSRAGAFVRLLHSKPLQQPRFDNGILVLDADGPGAQSRPPSPTRENRACLGPVLAAMP